MEIKGIIKEAMGEIRLMWHLDRRDDDQITIRGNPPHISY
jgi:hypothetical protein